MKLQDLKIIDKANFYGIAGACRFDRKVYGENLKDLASLLKQNNVKFLLAFGTCLGAVRDNGFVERDSDIDIMITEDQEHNLVQSILSPRFKEMRFQLVRIMGDLISVYRDLNYIDISVFRKTSRKDGRLSCLDRHTIEPYRFQSAKQVNFIGDTFLVPADPESYLTEKYGNWKVKSPKHAST